jgi:hypothetical protein
VIEVLVNLPNPILEFLHTPLPPKCCEPESVLTSYFSTIFILDSFESFEEVGNVSILIYKGVHNMI